jgi:hypothetical protein
MESFSLDSISVSVGATNSFATDIDCSQCLKNDQIANKTVIQTGRLDVTREVFPWL